MQRKQTIFCLIQCFSFVCFSFTGCSSFKTSRQDINEHRLQSDFARRYKRQATDSVFTVSPFLDFRKEDFQDKSHQDDVTITHEHFAVECKTTHRINRHKKSLCLVLEKFSKHEDELSEDQANDTWQNQPDNVLYTITNNNNSYFVDHMAIQSSFRIDNAFLTSKFAKKSTILLKVSIERFRENLAEILDILNGFHAFINTTYYLNVNNKTSMESFELFLTNNSHSEKNSKSESVCDCDHEMNISDISLNFDDFNTNVNFFENFKRNTNTTYPNKRTQCTNEVGTDRMACITTIKTKKCTYFYEQMYEYNHTIKDKFEDKDYKYWTEIFNNTTDIILQNLIQNLEIEQEENEINKMRKETNKIKKYIEKIRVIVKSFSGDVGRRMKIVNKLVKEIMKDMSKMIDKDCGR
eukprot:GAHX01001822.1.p1 GENE.GAHX01001822.1~~GAHX01001822.1.p1  ORF type:complete len:409 (-),score=70.24 GAHX01001822.1:25-1251(-)